MQVRKHFAVWDIAGVVCQHLFIYLFFWCQHNIAFMRKFGSYSNQTPLLCFASILFYAPAPLPT